MMRLCVFLVALCLTCAQPSPPEEVVVEPVATEEIPQQPEMGMVQPEMVMAQVQQEEMMARRYLEVVMKIQHAQYAQNAGSLWMQSLQQEMEEDKMEKEGDFEENVFYDNDSEFGQDYEESNLKQAKQDLMASYFLFRATNLKQIQTIFSAGDVQREFFMDRAMQYFVQSAGAGLPPQLIQVFYMKTYLTMLKTMRLSYAFQYLSHFRTWLEDSLDIGTVIVEGSADNIDNLWDDAEDDLIRDKQYAFHAFYTYSFLDFQIFYIDMYLEYIFMNMSGSMGAQEQPAPEQAQAQAQASLLEVESTAEPAQSQSSFLPFMGSMGSMGYQQNPAMYMKVYHMFTLYFQLQSAQSAYMSVNMEAQSYELLNDDLEENDEQAEQMRTYAQHLFGTGFAQNMYMGAQLESMTAMLEMYTMYAPAIAGSLGGSMSSMGGSSL